MATLFKATPAQRLFQLLLISTAAWAVIYTRFTLGPLQEAMRRALDLTDTQIALLIGPAVAVPLTLGAIPAGLIIDRYPRAPLFALFMGISAGATLLTAFTTSLPLLIFARALVGLALGATVIAAFSLISDLYEPDKRGRATMAVLIGETAGAPAAFALGGVLLVMGGSTSNFGLEGWRWAQLWMAAPLLICTPLMLALREPPRSGVLVKKPPLREVFPELWRYRGIVLTLLVGRTMAWVGDGAVTMWGAPTFERNFGLSPQSTGAIMAMGLLISGVAGSLFGGPLADYCQRRGGPRKTITVLAISMLLSAPLSLYGLMPNAMLAGIAMTVFLGLGFIGAAAGMAVATVIIPGELRGLYVAITLALVSVLSLGLAPVLVSGLSVLLGGTTMIGHAQAIVGLSTAIVGAIVFARGRKYFAGDPKRDGSAAALAAERA